jgi:hypothetical protein
MTGTQRPDIKQSESNNLIQRIKTISYRDLMHFITLAAIFCRMALSFAKRFFNVQQVMQHYDLDISEAAQTNIAILCGINFAIVVGLSRYKALVKYRAADATTNGASESLLPADNDGEKINIWQAIPLSMACFMVTLACSAAQTHAAIENITVRIMDNKVAAVALSFIASIPCLYVQGSYGIKKIKNSFDPKVPHLELISSQQQGKKAADAASLLFAAVFQIFSLSASIHQERHPFEIANAGSGNITDLGHLIAYTQTPFYLWTTLMTTVVPTVSNEKHEYETSELAKESIFSRAKNAPPATKILLACEIAEAALEGPAIIAIAFPGIGLPASLSLGAVSFALSVYYYILHFTFGQLLPKTTPGSRPQP